MSYQLFHDYFPELAEKETRVIHVFEPSPFADVPPGDYALLEMFCADADCDCRRVMWVVQSEPEHHVVAVVAHGWASARFYQNWFGRPDADIVREMQGPVLNRGSPQARYAPAILAMLTKVVLTDKAYMNRVTGPLHPVPRQDRSGIEISCLTHRRRAGDGVKPPGSPR